jgi:hypothetical protein
MADSAPNPRFEPRLRDRVRNLFERRRNDRDAPTVAPGLGSRGGTFRVLACANRCDQKRIIKKNARRRRRRPSTPP